MFNPDQGRQIYQKAHIPGAHYFDLNKDLASARQEHGGNHPLPDSEVFTKKLGQAGIDRNTTVVIYDQTNDIFAARMYWLLKYFGHEHTYILDGGVQAWAKGGYSITSTIPQPSRKTFEPTINKNLIVNMEELKNKQEKGGSILIDSRSCPRYLGEEEPLYAKAGHIPGAKNYDWQELLTADKGWKTQMEIREHFASLDRKQEVIVSCGSGVSACMNILGLWAVGFEDVKLYPGSFSDWISYSENTIETIEE